MADMTEAKRKNKTKKPKREHVCIMCKNLNMEGSIKEKQLIKTNYMIVTVIS